MDTNSAAVINWLHSSFNFQCDSAPGTCLQGSCNISSDQADGDSQPENVRPASRCGAGESSDWGASGSFGRSEYARASPSGKTGGSGSSRARADNDGGERSCEKDIASSVCPRGFLNVWVCEEGGAVILDCEGEDGGCGRGDGVEGAGYCQCRCGGLRLRWNAFIARGGGEEREEEEKGSGESGEAHFVRLM